MGDKAPKDKQKQKKIADTKKTPAKQAPATSAAPAKPGKK